MIKSAENKNENGGESLLESLYTMTKESTQNECNAKLLQKIVELNNKIFYHQVEQHCLNERINELTSQIQLRDQNQRILSLQLSIQQSDANTYKQKVTMLEQLIESMRQQKKLIIRDFQQSQNKLRAKIEAKQKDYTTSIQIKEEQTKQRQGQIKGTLERISKELKEEKQKNQILTRKNDQSQKSFQAYYSMYEELKNMVISKLSQNKEQNPDISFLTQLVDNICFKVQGLELERKKIQQFITIQQGNNNYREQSLFNRVKINFKNYEEKALRKQKNLENVEIFLNNLLKSEGFQNDFSYGEALLEKLKDRFIDYKAKLLQQKKNTQDYTQKYKIKDEEIKKLKEISLQFKQQSQRVKKQWIQALQELEKQRKVGQNYKKSYEQLSSQLEENNASSMLKMSKISQNFQSQSARKEEVIQNLNKKLRDIELKKQNEINDERKKREKLEERLNQLQNEIDAEVERFKQAQKKHRKQIEQIEKSNKNGQERTNKIRGQCQLQKIKIKSEFDEYKKKYVDLEDNNKYITKMIDEMKHNLEIKNLQIQQIQQQLCTIVNQARLERNQSTKNAQTFKQALSALNKLLKDSGAKIGSSLFKIPSLSEKYEANIQWVKGIIDQYCGCGTKFQSKFIGKIDENFRDFAKILNNQNLIPNVLLIIQTSKGSVFSIFITKFTTTIKDRDPVMLFSGEKKLKYPSEQKKNHDTRPSIINFQGALQFGKKELTITKMLELKLNILPAGYFGNVDIQSMYGIQTVAEPVNVQKMEIHQIVF